MSDGQVSDHDSDAIPDLVAAARRVAPDVLLEREQAEQLRQIPPSLAEAISKAGLYQTFWPRSVGGPEASPLVAFHAIEELSKADGSVG
jgi:alkylation response protein AidB-like acyl-CoA dehydrogenase